MSTAKLPHWGEWRPRHSVDFSGRLMPHFFLVYLWIQYVSQLTSCVGPYWLLLAVFDPRTWSECIWESGNLFNIFTVYVSSVCSQLYSHETVLGDLGHRCIHLEHFSPCLSHPFLSPFLFLCLSSSLTPICESGRPRDFARFPACKLRQRECVYVCMCMCDDDVAISRVNMTEINTTNTNMSVI